MTVADAFQLVLELARQNIAPDGLNHEEHARQVEACNIIEDLAVNEYGDD